MHTNDYHQLGVGEYEAIAFEDVLQRFYIATGTGSQAELANWLGIRQSFISDAKRRNRVPVAWLRAIMSCGLNYSPLWILIGKEPKLW